MLNISKQIYYGWNSVGIRYPLPEAEIIPGGSSINEKKRLESVTKKYTDINEYDNIPLPGFTLFKTNRKNYGSADPTWLIIDPRGFLARITNENLEDILYVTGITEGLIQEKCVWARHDNQTKLTLIPVSSDSYIEAVKNTELLADKINLKQVQIGDMVLLQNELTGIYMGIQSLYAPIKLSGRTLQAQIYPKRQILKVDQGKYHYQGDIKILKVIKKADKPLSREEAADLMNEDIATGNTFFTNSSDLSNGYYTSRDMVKYISSQALVSVPMSLEELTYDNAVDLFNKASTISDSGMIVVEDINQQKYIIDFPYSISSTLRLSVSSFCVDKINWDPVIPDIIDLQPYEVLKYGYTRNNRELHGLDKFVKYYKIVKYVKNGSYV